MIQRAQSRHSVFSNRHPVRLRHNRVQHIHSGRAHLFRALRAQVHIDFVRMIHLGAVHASRLKMHGKPSKHTIHLFSISRQHPHRLGKIQRVEHSIRRRLRQALHTQIAVASNRAHRVTRLIDAGRDQAVRLSTPELYPDISDVIRLRRKLFQFAHKLFRKLLLVSGNRRRIQR